MPKVIFEFNLPEETREYKIVSQADNMEAFLRDFSQQLRAWRKYGHTFKDADDALDKIREEFYRVLNDYQVNL